MGEPRYCKKCTLAFLGDTCAGGHANFMYQKKIPEGVALPEVEAELEAKPKPAKKLAGAGVKLAAPAGLGALLGGGAAPPPAREEGIEAAAPAKKAPGKLAFPLDLAGVLGGAPTSAEADPPPGRVPGKLAAPAGLGALIGGGPLRPTQPSTP